MLFSNFVSKDYVLQIFKKRGSGRELPLCDTRTPRGKKINQTKNRLENAQLQIKNLKVMYTNCDTLSNKFEELEIAVKIENPSAIILVEVAPKNARYQLQKSEFELDSYQLFINDFTKKMLEV